jgi:hypothetical protein
LINELGIERPVLRGRVAMKVETHMSPGFGAATRDFKRRAKDDRDAVRLPLCTIVQLIDDDDGDYELLLFSELGQKIIAPMTSDAINSLRGILPLSPLSRK